MLRRHTLHELAKHPGAAMPFGYLEHNRVALIALETVYRANLDKFF